MSAHRRAPRPYRGGKRRFPVDLSVKPHAEKPIPAPGTPDGPGRTLDLAFNPAEARDEKGRWTINPANIVNRWMQATAGERAAGADWYPAAHRTAKALSRKYKIPVTEAAGLLATYSPQTPWGRNQVLAAETLREGHGLGGPGGVMYFTHNDPRVEDRVGLMATGTTRKVADAMLRGDDFDQTVGGVNKDGSLKPKALKIRAFYHLIAEGKQTDPNNPYVVIDRHAMSVAFGRRVTEEDYTRMRPGSGAKYAPFVQAYKDAAAEISRTEGRTVSPEQVQATTWLTQQRLNAAEITTVGKTRAKLGKKDWNEWLQYAATYLGLDPAEAAKTGYMELAQMVQEGDIDLDRSHYNPAEPRDEKGRWTDGVTKAAKRFKTILSADEPSTDNTVYEEPLDPYSDPNSMLYRVDAMEGHPSPTKGEAVSERQQLSAQTKATKWWGDSYGPHSTAQMVWAAYQNPNAYGDINNCLRGLHPKANLRTGYDEKEVTKAQLETAVDEMFDQAGTTTKYPFTTYRALRSKDRDWVKILTPGTTFREDGIVSTTVFRRMAQGWLGLKGTSDVSEHPDTIDKDAVVLEIHVPVGSRIVGGSTGFIETMLPPGTQFKVRSQRVTRTPNAINPLHPLPLGDVTYTHIVADAILPPSKPKPKHRASKGDAALKARSKAAAAAIDRAAANAAAYRLKSNVDPNDDEGPYDG